MYIDVQLRLISAFEISPNVLKLPLPQEFMYAQTDAVNLLEPALQHLLASCAGYSENVRHYSNTAVAKLLLLFLDPSITSLH